jgi:hypothetical protein
MHPEVVGCQRVNQYARRCVADPPWWRSILVLYGPTSLFAGLYLATPFQVLDDILKRIIGFILPDFEGLDVADVFRKRGFDRLVHQFGNTAIGFSCFQSQRSMQVRVEVDGGPFFGYFHS